MATKSTKEKIITLIPVDGPSQVLKDDQLDTMQGAVGGYVEVIRMGKGAVVLVNEEGLIHNLPFNPTGSRIVGQPVVGPVVVIQGNTNW